MQTMHGPWGKVLAVEAWSMGGPWMGDEVEGHGGRVEWGKGGASGAGGAGGRGPCRAGGAGEGRSKRSGRSGRACTEAL